MIEGDKILSTNIKIFTLMLEDSGKFFVLETKTGREIMDMASVSFKDNFLNYKENASSMRKALLAFLSMRAYRQIKGIRNPDINSLFSEDLVNLHSSLLQKEEFKNNALLRALIADKIPFGEKNRSNLKGLTLHKLAFNSRTKNNPDYVERLIDDFKLLATSPDPEAKQFAAEAFMYLMMKDAGLFKSDTFIRQIAPIFLKNISVGLDKVQDLFSNGQGTFEDVFGIPKEKLVHEFVELFARYAPNNFYLKGNKLDFILNVNSSEEDIAEVKRLEKEGEATSDDVKAVQEAKAPVFYNNIKQTLTFNLKKGVKKGDSAEEIEKIMGINKSILGSTGLFDEKGGKIIYPPFIQVTMKDGQGGATKVLFKLDILHTGEIRFDENGNVETHPKYSRNTSDYNLFASEMTGTAATYIPVNPYLEKSIAPWFWTTEELEAFRIIREAKQSATTDAEIASAEEATTEEENAILAALAKINQSFNPLISPSVTPAATPAPSSVSSAFPKATSTPSEKPTTLTPSQEKEVQTLMSSFNVSRDKAVELVMKKKNQSKSSSKQPINQAALTNILDKLSNKFGISWKYDTSIPGLGQFKDGVVLINPNKAKLDTPFHEFAHPFIAIIKVQNPLLYKNLVSQISKTEIGRSTFEKVKKLYPELTYEQQLEETIVDLIGQYAADQQSLKQEKGLWNAIKTFLRRVSEYLKSLLGNENKKVIPSELDPNITMEELSSMLVIDNPIDLGTMLGKGYKKPSIKPGVQELFDSNPELANQVYEALGFNQLITPNDKIVFGHPTIGKSYLKNQGENKFISLDDDYATEINNKVKEIADKYNVTTYQVKDGGTQKWNNEYNQMMQEMFNVAKQRAISENKTLFTSNTNLLRNNTESFDKVINLTDVEFEKRIKERGAKYDIKEWKSQINEVISKIPTNKVITTDKYLSNLFITPQQKQQALQLYSSYLDTIFPNSPNKKVLYHIGGKNIEKFDKTMFGKGEGTNASGLGVYFQEDPYEIMSGGIGSDYFYESQTPIKSMIEDGVLTLAIADVKPEDSFNKTLNVPQEIVVRDVDRIHILGSKQDIEGFKEFASNPVQRVNLDKPTTLFNIFANVADSDVIELINNCN